MTKNFELLWKVYDHIKAHPEEWRQHMWITPFHGPRAKSMPYVLKVEIADNKTQACGTAFCFAGHAAYAAGWTPIWEGTFDQSTFNISEMTKDGRRRRKVWSIAREELGLTHPQADVLFDGDNTLEDIHAIITAWEEKERANV